MAKSIIDKGDKETELTKYKDLVLATLQYYLDIDLTKINTANFHSEEHLKLLKIQAEEHYQKGRLSKLKQWFRDLTEMMVETKDLKFNNYLKQKTKYNIDIFKPYFQRIDKIIEKGKVTTDNQFYDIQIMVDQLYQAQPADEEN